AVLRFDFHGTGDSAGDERLPERVRAWREDVRLAAAELRARSFALDLAIVGVRLGATLATTVAEETGAQALVLWGAYARGASHVAAQTLAFKLHRKMEPASFAGGPAARDDGEEVFGFLLTRATIAELAAIDARSCPTSGVRRALLVGDGRG